MKTDSYLSKIILSISVVTLAIAFFIFPMLLEKNTNDELVTCSLRDTWLEMGYSLPTPTIYALYFTDYKVTRIIIFVCFLIVNVSFEFLCKNKVITGIYHLTFLFGGSLLGWFYLMACLVPSITMGC